MADDKEVCVQVSMHAVLRWRERGGKGHDGFEQVRLLAVDAITAGRKAKRKPRALCGDGYRSRVKEPDKRYLWTEDESFFLVARYGRKCWYIVTVMGPKA